MVLDMIPRSFLDDAIPDITDSRSDTMINHGAAVVARNSLSRFPFWMRSNAGQEYLILNLNSNRSSKSSRINEHLSFLVMTFPNRSVARTLSSKGSDQ